MNNKERFNILYEDMMKISCKCTSNFTQFNSTHGPVNKGCWECKYSPQGECRMMTCLCCENDDKIEEENNEWFFGICDNCEDEIYNKYVALRIPKEEGGWIGCFCSLQCLREVFPDGDDDKNPIREALLLALEQNLTEYPINTNQEYGEDL